MYLGQNNILTIVRFTAPGAFLTDAEDNEVLLPNRYLTEEMKEGDEIEVFIYKDSEDRLVAVTDKPLIDLYSFAYLKCKEVNQIGAFMDWGMEKDLLVPYKEQAQKLEEGKSYVVFMGIDDATQRLFGSTRIQRYLDNEHIMIKEGDEVDLMISGYTDLGCKVIINDTYGGLVFRNQLIKDLPIGSKSKGFIKHIRPDGKIDVTLERQGYIKVEDHLQTILRYLEDRKSVV